MASGYTSQRSPRSPWQQSTRRERWIAEESTGARHIGLVGHFTLKFTGFVLEQKNIYFSITTWLTSGLCLRSGWIAVTWIHLSHTITRTCPDPLLQKCRPTPDTSKTSMSPPFWACLPKAMITGIIPFLSLIILFMFCGFLGICPEEQAHCYCAGVVLSLNASRFN